MNWKFWCKKESLEEKLGKLPPGQHTVISEPHQHNHFEIWSKEYKQEDDSIVEHQQLKRCGRCRMAFVHCWGYNKDLCFPFGSYESSFTMPEAIRDNIRIAMRNFFRT